MIDREVMKYAALEQVNREDVNKTIDEIYDSIGTCESCKYSKQSRTFSLKPIKDRFDCSYLSLQMKPKGFYCGDFEGKQ